MNVDDVIQLLGGTVEAARIFGVEPSAVSNWRKRGFPERMHYRLSRALKARNVEIDPALIEVGSPPLVAAPLGEGDGAETEDQRKAANG